MAIARNRSATSSRDSSAFLNFYIRGYEFMTERMSCGALRLFDSGRLGDAKPIPQESIGELPGVTLDPMRE